MRTGGPIVILAADDDLLTSYSWRSRDRDGEKCADELRALIHELTRAIDRLSPQEQQVAELAAAGLSNREVGARLFLSPRPVGSHLYRIYPKLGVTARGDLARALDLRES